MDIYPAISGEVAHTLFCAACLSFLWGVSETAGYFHKSHNTYEAVRNSWALCLYLFYAGLAVLAGLILIETGAMQPGWLSIFLLGFGAPAILRANFNPLQNGGEVDGDQQARMERFIENIRRFVFGEIERSLKEKRNRRREKVLEQYTAEDLEKQIDLRLGEGKKEYDPMIDEVRDSPARLKALLVTILDQEDPNAIDELAVAVRDDLRDQD